MALPDSPFGALLRAEIAAQGFSMRSFAVAAGASHTWVAKAIRGEILPPLGRIEHWATILHLTDARLDAFILTALEAHGIHTWTGKIRAQRTHRPRKARPPAL